MPNEKHAVLDIKESWTRVVERLRSDAPQKWNDLNPCCTEGQLNETQKRVPISFPDDLRVLYRCNDGQKGHSDGVFQFPKETFDFLLGPLHGLRFLPLDDAVQLYVQLSKDKDLDVFVPEDFPFAHDGSWDMLCMHAPGGEIFGMWTGGPDWTLPRDWQTARKLLAPNMADFLAKIF